MLDQIVTPDSTRMRSAITLVRYTSATRNQASIWANVLHDSSFSVGVRGYIRGRAVVECVP